MREELLIFKSQFVGAFDEALCFHSYAVETFAIQ
jgi:hypothetical protein